MLFENGDRIVFAGDSVTDVGSVNPVGEGLGDNLGRGCVRIVENLLCTAYPNQIGATLIAREFLCAAGFDCSHIPGEE